MRAAMVGLLGAGLALAQADADTIAVQATGPSAAWSRDQIQVTVTVTAPGGTGVDAVLAAVADAGMTERELVGVGSSRLFSVCVPGERGCAPSIPWGFRRMAALSKIKETFAALARVSSAAHRGMSISYGVTTSGHEQEEECAYPTLVSQARRHAENLAAAAGLRVGRVTAVSDGKGGETPAVRQGDFSAVLVIGRVASVFSYWFDPPLQPAAPCTAVVQFQLLR